MPTPEQYRRVLVVLPGIPERRTGGGLLLFEVLAHLASRADVAAVVPVGEHGAADFDEAARDPLLARVEWHRLTPHRAPGIGGYAARLVAALPLEVHKFAVEANWRTLEAVRERLRPDAELAISSWALAAYRGAVFPPGVRLYMVNVDPAIVWYDGPSLKRRIACLVDRPKVDRLCRRALRAAERVGAISAADVPDLERMGRRRDVAHVPPLMRPQPVDRSRARADTVLITTNFTYSQNVTSLEWFFREVWPRVSGRARLTVTGKDEQDRLARLCCSQPRTDYAGLLSPSALDAAFAETAVAVNPTRRGSGFQIKLLDAIARGVPIVSTAFSNRIGDAIPSSDDPRELAALIDARLVPGTVPPFDYAGFHRDAVVAWERFLFA